MKKQRKNIGKKRHNSAAISKLPLKFQRRHLNISVQVKLMNSASFSQ